MDSTSDLLKLRPRRVRAQSAPGSTRSGSSPQVKTPLEGAGPVTVWRHRPMWHADKRVVSDDTAGRLRSPLIEAIACAPLSALSWTSPKLLASDFSEKFQIFGAAWNSFFFEDFVGQKRAIFFCWNKSFEPTERVFCVWIFIGDERRHQVPCVSSSWRCERIMSCAQVMYQPYVPYLSYDRSAASAATDVADKVTLSFIWNQMSFGGWKSGFRPPAAFAVLHAGAITSALTLLLANRFYFE